MASPTQVENPYAAPLSPAKAPPENPSFFPAGPPTNVRYFVAAALCLAAAVVYIQRNSISVVEGRIREDLSLDKDQMGLVMSAFFLSYALLQVPSGAIAQWLGVRHALTFFVALSSLMSAAMAVAGGFAGLIVVRALMGLAQAGVFPAAAAAVAAWIPVERRGIVNGTLAGFMSAGGAAGAMFTGLMMASLSWQAIFATFALPGLVWCVVFWLWYRNRPQEHRAVNAAELALIARTTGEFTKEPPPHAELKTAPPAQASSRIAAILALTALCTQQVFRGAGYTFFASWFATYLRETHGVEDVAAGVMNGLPLAAVVVGSPLSGWLVDVVLRRTGSYRLSRQGVAFFASLACAAVVLLSMSVANVWLAVLLISAGSFFASFGGPCAYCGAIDIGGKYTPLAFGLMNMTGNFGAAAFPLITPWLLRQPLGVSPTVAAAGGNWRLVLLSFAGMYIAAAIFWLGADTKQRLDGGMRKP